MGFKNYSIAFGLLLLLFCNQAQSAGFSSAKLDSFLVTFVNEGQMNYAGAKASPRLLWDYIHDLENLSPKEFAGWDAETKMTFWINAYNAMVIQGILVHYPLDWGNLVLQTRYPKNSVYQIKNFTRRSFFKIMGQKWTLEKIRTEILQNYKGDLNVFLALVSGRKGDPPLPDRAFTPENLEQQLNQITRRLFSERRYFQVHPGENRLVLAPVFEAFKSRVQSPPDWQAYEQARFDSLTRIQQDSVRRVVPALANTLFQRRKQEFDQHRAESQEKLTERFAENQLEIEKAAFEAETLQPAEMLAATPNSLIEPNRISWTAASDFDEPGRIKLAPNDFLKKNAVRMEFVNDSLKLVEFFTDSLIAVSRKRLDSLRLAGQSIQDSMTFGENAKMDSVQFYATAYDSLLAVEMQRLPAIPRLRLENYKPELRGIVTLLMDFSSESQRDWIRRNHPAIEFGPMKKELNEAIY